MHEFSGNIEVKVDNKGRLIVPAAYRKSLERWEETPSLYLKTEAKGKYVKIYPESVWKKKKEELKANLNLWNKEHEKIYRQFISCVDIIELDSNGRALIQKKHLETTGIESDALIVGMEDHFEIWNKDNFEGALFDDDDFDSKLDAIMGGNKLN